MNFTPGEIIGHRYWIASWGGNLFGPHSWHHWHTNVPMSGKVARDTHGGVYALKTRELIDQFLANKEALKELSRIWRSPSLVPPSGQKGLTGLVIGTVRLWGTVWEHEAGFRAQYGRVHTIDELFDGQEFEQRRVDGPDLALLRMKYGCSTPSDAA
jgi:hypothetical protein